MKILKLGIFSLLAILAVSVFLTSCEQEVVNDLEIREDVNQIKAQKELKQLEDRLVNETVLQKEITISDDETGLAVTFGISTNMPELFNHYKQSNLKLKLGEVLSEETSDRISTETGDSQVFTPIDMTQNIIKLEVLNISSPVNDVEDIPTFSLKLEDDLRQAVENHNAITIINLENLNLDRWCSNGISSVKMTSDGRWDFRKAEARVYYYWNNCNFLQCRSGKFYSCLTSKVTNTGAACNAAYIKSVVRVGSEPVWTTFFAGCNASC